MQSCLGFVCLVPQGQEGKASPRSSPGHSDLGTQGLLVLSSRVGRQLVQENQSVPLASAKSLSGGKGWSPREKSPFPAWQKSHTCSEGKNKRAAILKADENRKRKKKKRAVLKLSPFPLCYLLNFAYLKAHQTSHRKKMDKSRIKPWLSC